LINDRGVDVQDHQGNNERWIAIQRAAAMVFKEKGYSGATMKDIADAVGILPGSLYYYVKSKQELLLHLVEQPVKDLVAGAEQIAGDHSDPVTKLKMVLEHHLYTYYVNYPQLFLVTEEPIEEFPAAQQAFLMDLKTRYKRAWEKIFEEGQNSGVFRPELDPSTTVYAILGACNWMAHWYRPDGRLNHDEVREQYTRFVLGGVLSEH